MLFRLKHDFANDRANPRETQVAANKPLSRADSHLLPASSSRKAVPHASLSHRLMTDQSKRPTSAVRRTDEGGPRGRRCVHWAQVEEKVFR